VPIAESGGRAVSGDHCPRHQSAAGARVRAWRLAIPLFISLEEWPMMGWFVTIDRATEMIKAAEAIYHERVCVSVPGSKRICAEVFRGFSEHSISSSLMR